MTTPEPHRDPNQPRRGPFPVEGMDLFEVYETDGSLLYVASYLDPDDPPAPTDIVYRRPWATAAVPLRRYSASVWGEDS